MSRSNNTELINPAVRFYEWNGESGGFKYFDKKKGDKGENVAVKLPFKFMVLDVLSKIGGFSDADQSGFWSNEVRDLSKETIIVRNKKGICAKGIYEEVIKDHNCVGAKYVQSVYIAIKDGNEMVIANIGMKGAALGAWIDFRKKNKVFDGAIEISEMVEGKKGKTVFQIPVFKKTLASDESNRIATDLDKELQEYLALYFKKPLQDVVEQRTEESTPIVLEEQEPYIPESHKEEIVAKAQAELEAMPPDDLPF